MKIKRSLFHILFQVTRLGWPGALGAGLLLSALVVDLLVSAPMEEAVATRQADATRRALLPVAAERVRKPLAVPRERVETALPRLFAIALQHDLSLDEGRYAEMGKAGDVGWRLRIDLPVSGTYAALRAFLADVLDENPALTLESLELVRDSIEETELEARMRFVLNQERAP